ncbi:MAG TPA: OmpA family protein [Polyangiaceae bacterium]|jgi:chemotaxis protein MotB
MHRQDNRARFPVPALVLLLLVGCGVSRADYDAKTQEAEGAKKQVATLEAQVTQLQQQLGAGEKQVDELKGALGMAQSQAMTDDQKSQLEEAKRAVADAQERGKLAADLQAKLKKMIDAGNLKVATRHGRIVLQLHDDVLFDKGDAEVRPDGKQAIADVAATLRQVAAKRFQIAGHTDNAPITTGKKKEFPTNWELSTARAIAVVKQLVSEGVDPSRLSAAGYGPYDPVASNATPDGQAKNRRIEIALVPYVAELAVPAGSDKKQ